MEENYQMIFNLVLIVLILGVGLIYSFLSKSQKAKNDNEVKTALFETIGAGIVFFFLTLIVFMVGSSLA